MRILSSAPPLLLCSITPLLLWCALPGGGEIWPLLFIALLPLLLLLQRHCSLRRTFFYGCVAGLLHNGLLLYWIITVLGRYGGLPWFFSVPGYLLLCLYMALYFALFLLLGRIMFTRFSIPLLVWLLPALWVGLDWLRSFLFSGFPWMDLGYGLWQVDALLQVSDLFGHRFLTFLVVLANCLFFLLVQERGSRTARVLSSLGVACIFAAVMIYGQVRDDMIREEMAAAEKVTAGVVQGNIDQSLKWSAEEQQRTVDTYLQGSASLLDGGQEPTMIVWPETALPFFPAMNPLFGEVQRFSAERRISLLVGAPWFEVVNEETREVSYFNSALSVRQNGTVHDTYFKSHLVPYGEYVPLKRFLPFLAPLVENAGDFTPGRRHLPLVSGEAKSGVLICFESIFPEISRKWVKNGANILVNLTNDAWYGRSSAPHQSMAMTVLRAVETRRSLVRAANTGISAFIDPAGRVLDSSDIFVFWAGKHDMVLMEKETFFTRYGYFFGAFCFFASAACLARRSSYRRGGT